MTDWIMYDTLPEGKIKNSNSQLNIHPPRVSYIVVVVLTLPHRYNAVGGHRTGSNNSGAKDCPRRRNK